MIKKETNSCSAFLFSVMSLFNMKYTCKYIDADSLCHINAENCRHKISYGEFWNINFKTTRDRKGLLTKVAKLTTARFDFLLFLTFGINLE